MIKKILAGRSLIRLLIILIYISKKDTQKVLHWFIDVKTVDFKLEDLCFCYSRIFNVMMQQSRLLLRHSSTSATHEELQWLREVVSCKLGFWDRRRTVEFEWKCGLCVFVTCHLVRIPHRIDELPDFSRGLDFIMRISIFLANFYAFVTFHLHNKHDSKLRNFWTVDRWFGSLTF